jgi:hypothetical protein
MRRRPADFDALSAPYFRLAGVFRGLPGPRKAGGRESWLGLAGARFLFLLFEKVATRASPADTHSSP